MFSSRIQFNVGRFGATTTLFPDARLLPEETKSSEALLASSDENILRELAARIIPFGLNTRIAFTVARTRSILRRRGASLVICDDRLIDGKYEDILIETFRSQLDTPVIVVSPTGGWSDYLRAIAAGAFDYLAFPPVPGDLQRSIQQALQLCTQGALRNTTADSIDLSSRRSML